MAITSITPGTELANVMEQTWRPNFGLLANEELVVAKNFDTANGITKIGRTINVSKISTIASTNLTSTAEMAASSLTYTHNTETNIAITCRDDYNAVSLGRNSMNQLLRSANYQAGLKKQLMSGLMTGVDVQAGSLVPSLSTNIVGSGAVNITKSLLLSAIAKLAASAKENFRIGITNAYLKVYVLQIDDLLTIPDITSANLRGDTVNPNVGGRFWPAYGLEISESGNISTSGGAAHNLLHITPSHLLAYGEEADVLPPQQFGLATLIHAYVNYAVGEVFDEYGVDVQTSTT